MRNPWGSPQTLGHPRTWSNKKLLLTTVVTDVPMMKESLHVAPVGVPR